MPEIVPPVPTCGDEVGDPPVGLLPELGARRLVVRARVVRVGVLVGLPGTGRLADQAVGDVVVRVRVLGVNGRRADDDLRAVRPHDVDLVRGHLVRAHEDALVALLLGDDGQADARVAAGRLHDRAAGLEFAALLGGLDHAQRDAVLHRPAGVEVLDFGQDRRLNACRHIAQPHQRGVADKTDHRIVELHRVLRGLRDGQARLCVRGGHWTKRLGYAPHGAGSAVYSCTARRRWTGLCRGRGWHGGSRRAQPTAAEASG